GPSAGPGRRAADRDGLGGGAGHKQAVLLIRKRSSARHVRADVVALDGEAAAALGVDAVDAVAGDQVAGAGQGGAGSIGVQATDLHSLAALDVDAVEVAQPGRAGRIGADVVGGDRAVARVQLDAVVAEAVNHQALDRTPGATARHGQAIGDGARAAALHF